MSIGQDPAPSNDEATRGAAQLALALPREGVVRLGMNAEYLHHVAVMVNPPPHCKSQV